jgi:hypothetical protein
MAVASMYISKDTMRRGNEVCTLEIEQKKHIIEGDDEMNALINSRMKKMNTISLHYPMMKKKMARLCTTSFQ